MKAVNDKVCQFLPYESSRYVPPLNRNLSSTLIILIFRATLPWIIIPKGGHGRKPGAFGFIIPNLLGSLLKNLGSMISDN